MANVLIVAYLLIVLAMIAVILLQRSEGGALGIGGSSTGLISVRGSANLLTRTTAILATLFFATAIGLTILSEVDRGTRGILQQAADSVGTDTTTPTNVLDALNQLQAKSDQSLAVPDASTATTTTATAPAAGIDPALALPQAVTSTPAPATTTAPAAAPAQATTPVQSMTAPATTTAPAQPMTAPTQTPAAPAQ